MEKQIQKRQKNTSQQVLLVTALLQGAGTFSVEGSPQGWQDATTATDDTEHFTIGILITAHQEWSPSHSSACCHCSQFSSMSHVSHSPLLSPLLPSKPAPSFLPLASTAHPPSHVINELEYHTSGLLVRRELEHQAQKKEGKSMPSKYPLSLIFHFKPLPCLNPLQISNKKIPQHTSFFIYYMLHKIAHSNVSSYSKDYFYYYFLHSLLGYCPFSFGALPRIPPKTSRANEISNFQQKLSPLMEE